MQDLNSWKAAAVIPTVELAWYSFSWSELREPKPTEGEIPDVKMTNFKISLISVVAELIGVFFQQLNLGFVFKISLTFSLCLLIMNFFENKYLPAGNFVSIPLLPNNEIQRQSLGYFYAFYPTLTGLKIIYSFSKIKKQLNTIYYGK